MIVCAACDGIFTLNLLPTLLNGTLTAINGTKWKLLTFAVVPAPFDELRPKSGVVCRGCAVGFLHQASQEIYRNRA